MAVDYLRHDHDRFFTADKKSRKNQIPVGSDKVETTEEDLQPQIGEESDDSEIVISDTVAF